MLKKISILILAASVFTVSVMAENLVFKSYFDAYLTAFTDIGDAQEVYKEAALLYEGAAARNASAIELEILLASKQRKAMDVRDKTSQAAIDAFGLFSQYQASAQSLAISTSRLNVAKESMKNDESQFALGLISETDYLTKKLNFQISVANLELARRTLEDTERKIARALGTKAVFAPFPMLGSPAIMASLSAVPLTAALTASADVHTAKANLSINEKTWKVISGSSFANELEKKDALEKYKTAKKAYTKAIESLEDSCIALERSIADLRSQYDRLMTSSRMADVSFDSAKLRKNSGKSTDLEFTLAQSDYQAKQNEIGQFAYKLIAKKLEILMMAGGDCVGYLREVLP